jgi:hypothetical protein
MKELGLYRTTKVNYVPYNTDGNGRDRYIVVGRGGLFPNSPINSENTRRTGTVMNTKVSYKSASPYYKAPNFHYHSDGFGRDSYIYTNGGGLIYDSKPLNSFKLTDFLRANDDNTNTIITNQQNCNPKNRDQYQKYLRSKEKDIINRLYENGKKKNLKNKGEYSKKIVLNETDEIKLPKLLDKKTSNTINKEIDTSEENKNENITLDLKKNRTNNNLDNEHFIKYLSKINNFDEKKRMKKDNNKLFNQAYLHLRNTNYNYE